MKKSKEQNGFTLGELLIVVAIIGVLVAISIPVFTHQLEKSREAVDLANVRAAYAEVMSAVISEDSTATYKDQPIYDAKSKVYQAIVPLKQQIFDWQMDKTALNVSGVGLIKDLDIQWFDEPRKDGYCTVIYDETSSRIYFFWDGQFYNYKEKMETALKKALSSDKITRLNCLNGTCDENGTIKSIFSNLTDGEFNKRIASWAAVRDPSDPKTAENYNYIMTTFDVNKMPATQKDSAGNVISETKVPVLYCDKNGNYSVGYGTVNKAPDKNNGKEYNLLTLDPNGKYPHKDDKNPKISYDDNYKSDTLVADAKSYGTNRSAAQAAYRKLVKEYLKEHPEAKEKS